MWSPRRPARALALFVAHTAVGGCFHALRSVPGLELAALEPVLLCVLASVAILLAANEGVIDTGFFPFSSTSGDLGQRASAGGAWAPYTAWFGPSDKSGSLPSGKGAKSALGELFAVAAFFVGLSLVISLRRARACLKRARKLRAATVELLETERQYVRDLREIRDKVSPLLWVLLGYGGPGDGGGSGGGTGSSGGGAGGFAGSFRESKGFGTDGGSGNGGGGVTGATGKGQGSKGGGGGAALRRLLFEIASLLRFHEELLSGIERVAPEVCRAVAKSRAARASSDRSSAAAAAAARNVTAVPPQAAAALCAEIQRLSPFFKLYKPYCEGFHSAIAALPALVSEAKGVARVGEAIGSAFGIVDGAGNGSGGGGGGGTSGSRARGQQPMSELALTSALIKPVQRVCKYPLLLREILASLPAPGLLKSAAAAVVVGVCRGSSSSSSSASSSSPTPFASAAAHGIAAPPLPLPTSASPSQVAASALAAVVAAVAAVNESEREAGEALRMVRVQRAMVWDWQGWSSSLAPPPRPPRRLPGPLLEAHRRLVCEGDVLVSHVLASDCAVVAASRALFRSEGTKGNGSRASDGSCIPSRGVANAAAAVRSALLKVGREGPNSVLRGVATDSRLRRAFLFSDMLVLTLAKSQSRRSLQWSSGGGGGSSDGGGASQYQVTHRVPLRAVRCVCDEELWGQQEEREEEIGAVNIMWDRPSPYAPVCLFLAPLGMPPRYGIGKSKANKGTQAEVAAGAAAAGVVIEWEKRYARTAEHGGDAEYHVASGCRRREFVLKEGEIDWAREIAAWASKCKAV